MTANELLTKGKEHPKIEKLREIIKEEISKNENAKIIVLHNLEILQQISQKK
jgi:ERCC4-related helicase